MTPILTADRPPPIPRTAGVVLAVADRTERDELAAALTEQGFAVRAVGSGLEALSEFLDHTGDVDAVVIDADLPDLPGPAFVRRMRTHFPGVPCVVRAADYRAEPGVKPAAVVAPADGTEVLTELLWREVEARWRDDD